MATSPGRIDEFSLLGLPDEAYSVPGSPGSLTGYTDPDPYITWTDGNQVRGMDLSSPQPTPTLLVDTVLQDARDLCLDPTNDLMMIADGYSGVIAYTDLAGSYDPGHLFPPSAGFLEVTSLTGTTDPEPLMPSIWFSAWVDGGVGYSIYRADLDVSGLEPLVDQMVELASGLGPVVDLALDEESNNLLIAETNQILKMDLSTNLTTQIATGMTITGIDVIPGSVIPEPMSLWLFLAGLPLLRKR